MQHRITTKPCIHGHLCRFTLYYPHREYRRSCGTPQYLYCEPYRTFNPYSVHLTEFQCVGGNEWLGCCMLAIVTSTATHSLAPFRQTHCQPLSAVRRSHAVSRLKVAACMAAVRSMRRRRRRRRPSLVRPLDDSDLGCLWSGRVGNGTESCPVRVRGASCEGAGHVCEGGGGGKGKNGVDAQCLTVGVGCAENRKSWVWFEFSGGVRAVWGLLEGI